MSVDFHGRSVAADCDAFGVSFCRLDRGFVSGSDLPFQARNALGGLAAQSNTSPAGVRGLGMPAFAKAVITAASTKLLVSFFSFQRAQLSGTYLHLGPEKCAVKLLDNIFITINYL